MKKAVKGAKKGLTFWQTVCVAACVVILLAVGFRYIQYYQLPEQQRWANKIMNEAKRMNEHFASITDLYLINKTDEMLDRDTGGCLDAFPNYWGVVLRDGTVVMSENSGDIFVDEADPDKPIGVRFMPTSTDALIIEGLDLPTEWRQQMFMTVQTHKDAPCYVGLLTGVSDDNGVFLAAVFVWDGTEYVDVTEEFYGKKADASTTV